MAIICNNYIWNIMTCFLRNFMQPSRNLLKEFIFVMCCLYVCVMCVLYTRINLQFDSIRQDLSKKERIVQTFLLRGHVNTFEHSRKTNACEWPPAGLYGRQKLNKTQVSFKQLEEMYSFVQEGHYKPPCQPFQNIAIVVPYRDREEQFKVFINNVIPRLYRQRPEFVIYVVEQADSNPFNRGMLANIGYRNVMADFQFDCIVIHDVDILPEDDRNLYFCSNKSVYHLAGKVERANYTHFYHGFVGGIVSLSAKQYRDINGFSNSFFGWGGEDDDFGHRVNSAGYKIRRPLLKYSHCGDVEHKKAAKNPERTKIMKKVRNTWRKEGLSSVNYTLLSKEKMKLFVRILVNTNM